MSSRREFDLSIYFMQQQFNQRMNGLFRQHGTPLRAEGFNVVVDFSHLDPERLLGWAANSFVSSTDRNSAWVELQARRRGQPEAATFAEEEILPHRVDWLGIGAGVFSDRASRREAEVVLSRLNSLRQPQQPQQEGEELPADAQKIVDLQSYWNGIATNPFASDSDKQNAREVLDFLQRQK